MSVVVCKDKIEMASDSIFYKVSVIYERFFKEIIL